MSWSLIILFLCDMVVAIVDIVDMSSKINMGNIKNINPIDEVLDHINIGK